MSGLTVTAAATNAVFRKFGEAAQWIPVAGAAGATVDCTVIKDTVQARGDGTDYRPAVREVIISVRASEVTPERGGFFLIGDDTWQVVEEIEFDGEVYREAVISV